MAQPIVVENRPGGDAIVAISAVGGAKDHHVLLFTPISSFTAHPYLHDNLRYKQSDQAPITRVSNTFIGVLVPAELPVNSVNDLIALARAKLGGTQLGASVTGALDFPFAGWLKCAKLEMKKIPYQNQVRGRPTIWRPTASRSMSRRSPLPCRSCRPARFLRWLNFLSHLRSYERYDEPETLPSSIRPFGPMSADLRQHLRSVR